MSEENRGRRRERQRGLNICVSRSLKWPALAGAITGLLQSWLQFSMTSTSFALQSSPIPSFSWHGPELGL